VSDSLSDEELRVAHAAGIAVFADRLILEAQPAIDEATLDAVAERCAGPLPEQLIALWRTAFGGRLDYDLHVPIDGHVEQLSFSELFYPGSRDYHDLWGWIDHECGLTPESPLDRLVHLPIGGFEYLERIYVDTVPGPDHGAVVCWRQGLPPGWERRSDDHAGQIADDLHALFGQLFLAQDPWQDPAGVGSEMCEAIDELGAVDDPLARSAAAKLRRLVQATVVAHR
jgi:hypothetical protein